MQGNRAKFAGAALGLGAVVANTSGAADATADQEKQPVTTVIVTGVAPDSPLTFITDPRLPRQPVPASDGADYLKTIPGFSAVRNGGTNGDPVLRGMFGSRLNLLTNDGLMPGACPARMDNPLSYVSPETYDRLIVIKGPQTVLWGPGASAGTVRFERDPHELQFATPELRVRGNALGGSFGRNDQVLDLAAGASRGYVRMAANRSESDDYKDGHGEIVPSRWEKWNADAAVGFRPAEGSLIELNAGTGDAEARYAGRSMDGAQFERTSYGLRFEKKNAGGALREIKANAFYNYADHVMDNYTLRDPNPLSAMPMAMAADVDRLTRGGRVAATWKISATEWTAGLDTQKSRHRGRSGMGENTYSQAQWETDANFSNTGVFGESIWRVRDTSRLHVGARTDHAKVTDERDMANGMMPMPNPTAGITRRESLPSGFVRWEQDLIQVPVTSYIGIGHAERMPDYWELFSPDMGPMGAVNAFSAIGPEKTTQLDMGLQYRSVRLDAWTSVYAGRIDDFILFTYSSGGMMGLTSSVSAVNADIHGGEAGIEWRPMPNWKLGGTLAYAWGENRDNSSALPQIPPLDAKLSLAYDNTRWSIGTLLRVVDGQNRVALDQGNVVGRDLGPTAGFTVLSFNTTYRFSRQVNLAAGVDNLLDRDYAEHLNLGGSADFGYPADPVRIHEPGRTAWVKLAMSY